MRKIYVKSCVCFLIFIGSPVNAADDRAIALLRGAEQARASLPPANGSFYLNSRTHTRNGKIEPQEFALQFIYAGELRTFIEKSNILIVPPQHADRAKEIQVMPEAEVLDKGLATKKYQEIRNAWGGSSAHNYWVGSTSANINRSSSGLILFDPRLIGISTDFSPSISFSAAFGYPNCEDAQIIGTEKINNVDAWHIRVDTAIGTKHEYWIEDRTGFRVHRFAWRSGKVPLMRVCESQFDPNDPASILPQSVLIKEYRIVNGQNILGREQSLVVQSLVFAPQSPPPGSIESLNLPIGTAIYDAKAKENPSGFWDGSRIVKEYSQIPKAKLADRDTASPPPEVRSISWWWIGLVSAGIVGIVFVLIYRVRRTRPTASPGTTP